MYRESWKGSMVPNIIKKSLQNSDIDVLGNSTMGFPTWVCLKDWIKEASDPNFPYQQFGTQPMQKSATFIPVNAEPSLSSIIQGKVFVGIDVPVLLKPTDKNNEKTIVIVGESPLRETNNNNNKNKILLGTPYAIHQQFGCPSQCNVYKKILNDLLKEGYSIYLTDIVKIWWKGKNLKADADDKKIFEKELQKILNNGKIGKDLFIVAWGNKAGGILEKDYPFLIKLPHPSQQNWNNWKLHIFEKAIYDKKDINYATSKYPQKDSKTNEGIVASEAVIEILDNINKIETIFHNYTNISEAKWVDSIANGFNVSPIIRDKLRKAGKKELTKLTMASNKTFGKQDNAYAAWWIRQKMLQILKK